MDQAKQLLGRDPAGILDRRMDRGQGRVQILREQGVIKTGHGNVVRYG
jgi:hypothetical protein